mmetsp:Transcript_44687/g.97236  ORF Transcript_44687/g.97236 Transcript_44687/m.97236 type:complete len:516 (+) Transcript_44687:57-1604(+)
METLPLMLPGPRGWSMRHGHRHHLEECSGRSSFGKSVARRPRDDKEETVECLYDSSSKARNTNKRKRDRPRLAYRNLEFNWHVEGLGASDEAIEESQWWEEEHEVQASLRLPSFAVAPSSSAEEAAFLQMALRESEEEANLQRAIQESLRQYPATPESVDLQTACEPADLKKAPEPADRQQGRPERLRLLRQRSAPCIASEFADAQARMAFVQVPLTAWLSPFVPSPWNAMRKGGVTPKESRWEQAIERAASVARGYVVVPRERCTPAKTAAKVTASTATSVGYPGRLYPTVPVCGKPLAPSEHLRVLELAMPKSRHGYPACWGAALRHKEVQQRVSPSSEEYKAVTDYFNATVNRCGIKVKDLIRLQNPRLYGCYDSDRDSDAIMFHGCRSQDNETSIIANGFQVRKCRSGGDNFGTWFAYGACYSDCNFVFVDPQGIRHLFVCVVSSKHVVLDDATMRVVGQGCAYPVWLLKYEYPASNTSTVSMARASPRKDNITSAPRAFHVVRDGSWALE